MVFIETFNFSFFSITGRGIGMDYCDTERFALETNRDYSVIFEIASKNFILDCFIDYDGYSISSKGFLPTVDERISIYGFLNPSRFISLCTLTQQHADKYNALLSSEEGI